jgi:hypothetical protein
MQASMRSAERRWAVIAEDGRHSWLGRHSDPSEEELAKISQSLALQSLAGWLAVVEGIYYGRGKLSVMMVRPLCGNADWESALNAFQEHRRQSLTNSG